MFDFLKRFKKEKTVSDLAKELIAKSKNTDSELMNYKFGFASLPQLIFSDATTVDKLNLEGIKFLQGLYIDSCLKFGQPPKREDVLAYKIESVKYANGELIIIEYPSSKGPKNLDLKKGIPVLPPVHGAIVIVDSKVNYYVSCHSLMGGATLRKVDGEMNGNMGPLQSLSKEYFVERIRELHKLEVK